MEHLPLVHFYVEGVAVSIVSIFGIIGNTISSLVLTRKEMRSATTVLILGLACSEMVFLISRNFSIGISLVVGFEDPRPKPEKPFWAVMRYISMLGQTCSIYFTVGISIERFIAVCHPLKVKVLCTWDRAVMLSASIFAFSLIVSVPQLFMIIDPTPGSFFEIGFNAYKNSVRAVLQFLIPFTCIVYFNTKISLKVRESEKSRVAMSQSQKEESSITKMLLVVVFVFGICYLPQISYSTLSFVRRFGGLEPEAKATVRTIMKYIDAFWTLFVITNSSINFIIYCTMGNKFRETFINMIHCREGGGGALTKGGAVDGSALTAQDWKLISCRLDQSPSVMVGVKRGRPGQTPDLLA